MICESRSNRRVAVIVNYGLLAVMNVLFYFASSDHSAGHLVDVLGLASFAGIVLTFFPLHRRTGLWRLTHARAESLDERELQETHRALGRSYAWFTVVCLLLMLAHAVFYRLVPGIDFPLTVPLVGSMIYLAHTLPGAVLAWSVAEVPGAAA
ncbi:hypothetical protein JW921_05710 [Candidatus Fermentibacterales bacterium]|nr:hypothetical protein [Candidatus Fermentibacterales bacterium]